MFGRLLIPSTPSTSTTPAVALASEQTLMVMSMVDVMVDVVVMVAVMVVIDIVAAVDVVVVVVGCCSGRGCWW